MSDTLGPRLERVLRLADDLAGAWSARARHATTFARERAVLRMFGVSGLDRNGLPLASAVVERYIGEDRERLAAGVALPFAIALLEYDVPPRQLALDVTSGSVDLAFESQLLADPANRARAVTEARRLTALAGERIDANRTARLELLGVLGDAPRPWVAATLGAVALDRAAEDAARLVEAGADLVRVRVPAIRELLLGLNDRGLAGPGIWARPGARASDRVPGAEFDATDEDPRDVPSGSQRALAMLRARIDEASADRRRYARLGTASPALAAPEQALVAALERVDAIEADPVAEIVAGGVDPDRALADHAWSHRLLRRAGATVVIGPGPLIVAPDLARGVPSDQATRAGRAFGMQALAMALARADGIRDGHIVAGALVPWLAEERFPATQLLAAIAVRRIAWPSVTLAFDEPEAIGPAAVRWPFLLAYGLAIAGPATMVMTRADAQALPAAVDAIRAAAALAAEVAATADEVVSRPSIEAQASALLDAAGDTLERVADQGWRAVLGEPIGGANRDRLGAGAVTERSESFDPLEYVPAG